jgi:hypothetical protein
VCVLAHVEWTILGVLPAPQVVSVQGYGREADRELNTKKSKDVVKLSFFEE